MRPANRRAWLGFGAVALALLAVVSWLTFVLVRLDRLSDKVQVVVVSDDAAVVDWARGLDGRGAVVELLRHL